MSTYATHIVLAQKVIHHFPNINKAEYFIGTIFPDIRYLNIVSRETSHIDPIIQKGDSSFKIGMKIHALVDQKRDEFFINDECYQKYKNLPMLSTGSKLYDDIILYNKISNWQEISDYIRNISEEEKAFNISLENLQKWHALTLDYIKQLPNDQTVIDFSNIIGLPADQITQINQTKNIILKDRPDYPEKFYNSFNLEI